MKNQLLLLAASLLFANAYAQKQPAVQQTGLRAPADVKIDGKTTEWGDLNTYNTATELHYLIANNDKKLFFAMQTTDPDVINRIASGGISVIFKKKNSSSNDAVSIQYPVLKNRSNLFFRIRTPKNSIPDNSRKAADSTMRVNNQTLDNLAKWIKVAGVQGLDTLSIYNENGIEANIRFDAKKVLTVEMSLPLELVKTHINQSSGLTYQLRVNGATPPNITFGPLTGSTLDAEGQAKLMESMRASVDMVNSRLSATTDFWGEYTLAK